MEREAIIASMESLETWAIVCTFLVAIGVAGEFFIGFRQRNLSKLLRSADDAHALVQERLIEESRAKVETAAAEIVVATRDIEKARAEAANANLIAEGERLARVKIEERLAPRRLTSEAVLAIRDALAPFSAGAKHVALLCPPDIEPASIGKPMVSAMRAAGWLVTDAWGHNSARAVGAIYVEVAGDADDPTRAAGTAFVKAIRSIAHFDVSDARPMEKIVVAGTFTGSSDPPIQTIQELSNRLDAATIRITIGPK